jgi:tRNA-dihydrouridine synthase
LNFWQEFESPIYALAPMEDVTDTVFREIVLSVSSRDKLHLLFSEFTSVDGLVNEKGRDAVCQRLHISESEKRLLREKNVKIIAQLWGSDPENFYKASKIVKEEFSFDGIDINMGCPVKKIVNQGGCSALILQPDLARELIHAAAEGSGLPVSVKTRIGFNSVETEKWIGNLLVAEPSAIIVHGRTRNMQSEGLADWNEIAKSVEIRDKMGKSAKILGNGDIMSLSEADEKILLNACDGVMIGRGIFSNPWLFSDQTSEKSATDKMELLLKHIELFTGTWGNRKNFAILKRFFKIYLSGFRGAAEMRGRLMDAGNMQEVLDILVFA